MEETTANSETTSLVQLALPSLHLHTATQSRSTSPGPWTLEGRTRTSPRHAARRPPRHQPRHWKLQVSIDERRPSINIPALILPPCLGPDQFPPPGRALSPSPASHCIVAAHATSESHTDMNQASPRAPPGPKFQPRLKPEIIEAFMHRPFPVRRRDPRHREPAVSCATAGVAVFER